MTTTILDDVAIDPDETETGIYSKGVNPEFSVGVVFYLKGDAESADVTVEWEVEPQDATDDFYNESSEAQKNVDITDGQAYHPETRGSGRIRISVTNNGANQTIVTVKADEHQM